MAEKKKRKSYPKVRTPAGILAYSYITKPDEGKKYSDGKFKCDVVVDGDVDLSNIEAAAEEAARIEWGYVPENLQLGIKDGTEIADRAKEKNPKDDEFWKEEFRGKKLIHVSSKFAPATVDAKRQELPEGVWPAAGDLAKVSAICFPWSKEEKVKIKEKGKVKEVTETVYGISLQMRAVQLLEKRNSGSANAADDFEDEDYEAPAPRPKRNADKSKDESEDEGSGDDDDF